MEWVAVLPVKSVEGAKSRLAPAWPDPADLAALVVAMRRDTVAALAATPGVVAVVVAVDRPGAADDLLTGEDGPLVDVVVQGRPGLNAALADADVHARSRWPGRGRVAVVGDLPALTPAATAAVLADASGHRRSYVPDLAGTGTTMLAVTRGPLDPRFGEGSAARHGRDAVALPADVAARHDVDVDGDLVPDATAPFGPATAAVLARRAEAVGCPGT